jgi:uncharacterized protein (DUF433 family)
MEQSFDLVGRGVFTVTEASRLTRIPSRRIRRWMLGYGFRSTSGPRRSPPAIHPDYAVDRDEVALSFADLIEIRFLDHFLQAGVTWSTIRVAASKAAKLLRQDHPFSSWRFKTDGKSILTEIASSANTRELLDLVHDQVAFKRILDPYLSRSLDFTPARGVTKWWHEAGRRRIVIDPQRALGKPIVAKWGVPTQALADSFRVEKSVDAVAAAFELPKSSVAAAIEFEQQLAA